MDFSKQVKIRLIEIDKNQKWLMERVAEETGLFCDGGYLWKVLNGERNAPKIVAAIRKVLELQEVEGDGLEG